MPLLENEENNRFFQLLLRISKHHNERLAYYAKKTGRSKTDLIRDAVDERIKYLDTIDTKNTKGRGIAEVPDHVKPRGLGPVKKKSTPSPTTTAPATPFEALKSPPFVVPDKVKRAFKNWAEFIEEADGIVDAQRRTKTIIEDIRQRVEEKDVQPSYEAFIDFLTARKESREPAIMPIGDVPMVGDV